MKTLLLTTAILFSLQARSQVWVEDNAVWHYGYFNPANPSGGYYIASHVSDSLIGAETCRKITIERMAFVLDQYGDMQLLGTTQMWDEFTYVSGDSVMRWDGSEFRLMYDFNAQVNDTWIVDVNAPTFNGCNDTSIVTVVAAGIENIQGTDYRYIDLQSPIEAYRPLNGRFYERFGGGYFLFPFYQECDQVGLLELDMFDGFRCFEDDSLTLNLVGEDCEYLLTHLSTAEISEEKNMLYPNPVHELIQVASEGIVEVEVRSPDGKEVLRYANQSGLSSFDVSMLANGVYLLVLKHSNGDYSLQRVVKH